MKISKTDLVKLIIESNNQGYNLAVKHADRNYDEFSADFREAQTRLRNEVEERAAEAYEVGRREALNDEALASAKSQAYEAGYKKGVEDQGRKTLELMAEAASLAREKIEASEPKLSVWFMPLGSGPALGYPPGTDKSKAIKAIRWAYGSGEGYGLEKVKDLVEAEPGTLVSCGEPLPQSKAVELYLLLQAAGFEVVLRAQD